MAIVVNGGHVARAIDFLNEEGKYFVIGGYNDPWTGEKWGEGFDESNPPTPETTTQEVTNIIGLKSIDRQCLVAPAPENAKEGDPGIIRYNESYWEDISRKFSYPDNPSVADKNIAITAGARYVYLECTLDYDNFPVATYRQIGVCTNAEPADSLVLAGSIEFLDPEHSITNIYTSAGVLEILDYRKPISRSADQKEKISLIVEF